MKRIIVSLIATFLGLIIGYTGYTYRANHLRLKLELQQTQQQKQELDNKLQDKVKESEELKKQNDDLQIQLQAKKQRQATLASVTRVQAPVVVPNCGDNQYAQFIYQHESGCRLNAINSIGCRGIGQACPGSKLPCGNDYACQNAFFTNYAIARYGSWYNAYVFWLNHRWW